MKRLLVAIDFSDVTHELVRYAANLAEGLSGELVLYHAVGVPTDIPVVAYRMKPDELEDWLQEQAEQKLEGVAAEVPGGDVRTRVDVGVPWRRICDAAIEEEADVILIGSHGYTPLERLVGTTARRVVEHADRPVLVVRTPAMLKKKKS